MSSWDGSTEDEPRHQYVFGDEGWPVGDPPSFEQDLVAFEGQGEEVEKCIHLITQLKRNDIGGLEEIRKHAPKLHARILEEDDPRQLIPDPRTGMTAGSLRYVIKHLAGTIEPPAVEPLDSYDRQLKFLKFVTQICITIWEYRCDRGVFEHVRDSTSKAIPSINFQSFQNAAAYLAIISFVLAGNLDERLVEYVQAVVWDSGFELACSVEPVRAMINAERQNCLKLVFSSLTHVFNGLILDGDQHLWILGQQLHGGLKSSTDSMLDLTKIKGFEEVKDVVCTKFPARFESTILDVLHTGLNRLKKRTPSFRSDSGELRRPRIPRQPQPRAGAGREVWAWMHRGFKRAITESPPTPEAYAEVLEHIILEFRQSLATQRRQVADSVQRLLNFRDIEFGRGSMAETEGYTHLEYGSVSEY